MKKVMFILLCLCFLGGCAVQGESNGSDMRMSGSLNYTFSTHD